MIEKTKKLYTSTFFIGTFLLLMFNRPFVGLNVFTLRLGELLILSSLLMLILPLITHMLKIKLFTLKIPNLVNILYFVLSLFALSIFVNNSNIFSSYTYKSSVYIWCIGYLFSGIIFSNIDSDKKYLSKFLLPIFMGLPYLHYFFSTGYFPNFIIEFFNNYSDKFEFTKASDIMLSLLVANILSFKYIKNDLLKMIYFAISVSSLLPLLLLMSRGSFVSAVLFLFIGIFYHRIYFLKNIKASLLLSILFLLSFIISTYNVNEVDFSFNIGFGENNSEELSVIENVKTISKKNDTRKAFLSLYISDGRLMSIDNTTNWRLDIWQDVFYDMKDKKILVKGYGHNEIIPVMTDPSAPGRLGRDGLNENVHNYFVNIFARGGLLQLIVFIVFYLNLLNFWRKSFSNFSILIFIIPVLFNSTLDMSMEGVQYPLVFFSFLGYLFSTEKDSKIINITS